MLTVTVFVQDVKAVYDSVTYHRFFFSTWTEPGQGKSLTATGDLTPSGGHERSKPVPGTGWGHAHAWHSVSQCPVSGQLAQWPQGQGKVPDWHSGLQTPLLHGDIAEPSITRPRFSRFTAWTEQWELRGGTECLMVNNCWCGSASIAPLLHSSMSNLGLLTIERCPLYLPLKFSLVIVSTRTNLWEAHAALSYALILCIRHQDAVLIVAGEFNSANLKHAVTL